MHKLFLSTYNEGISRAESIKGQWQVSRFLADKKVQCLVSHPQKEGILYAGCQQDGIWISTDFGESWEKLAHSHMDFKSIAINPQNPSEMIAGMKPAAIMRSSDGGQNWTEAEAFQNIRGRWWWFSPAEPPGIAPYVVDVAYSPKNPQHVLAGVELGAVSRSTDGGLTWTNHIKRSLRDCHSLKFHSENGDFAYEAGGSGGGASISRDGGQTWTKASRPLGKNYGIVCGFDYFDPEIWYVVTSSGPGKAFGANSKAFFYRRENASKWVEIGWEAHPMSETPTALLASKAGPGHLYAGTRNGFVFYSENYGQNWQRLPFQLDGIWFNLIGID
jgi:photosystem II stability/assembly factor-like uncharacterized protein